MLEAVHASPWLSL
ncbi:hypothetical protein A2U01_0086641, partial [Trifolium medium]|nr:hypothetical protein [Trifolium medium]